MVLCIASFLSNDIVLATKFLCIEKATAKKGKFNDKNSAKKSTHKTK